MVLSDAEKKQHRIDANHRYYMKKKQQALVDEIAKEKWERDTKSRRLSTVRSFVRNHATLKDLYLIEKDIAERRKKLEVQN